MNIIKEIYIREWIEHYQEAVSDITRNAYIEMVLYGTSYINSDDVLKAAVNSPFPDYKTWLIKRRDRRKARFLPRETVYDWERVFEK